MPELPVIPTFDDVVRAAGRLKGITRRTPALPLHDLCPQAAGVWLKCENFQITGAFKFRGAMNALLCLDRAIRPRGVATHSSGNHGGALAYAAKQLGVPAHVVVPSTISAYKRSLVESNGATIYECGPTLAAREAMLAEIVAKTGASVIHPYDDADVIAGQGTATLELLEEVPEIDTLIVCISGGGLMSGSAIAAHGVNPKIDVVGAEPDLACDAKQSLERGTIVPSMPTSNQTIADGLRASLSPRTFTVIREHVRCVITASEEQIVESMRLVWDRAKLLIEPSSAVPIAALLAETERFAKNRVGVIITGGNVSLDRLPWQK